MRHPGLPFFLILFLLPCGLSVPLSAQSWEPFGPPGGTVTCLAFDASTGISYAGATSAIYRMLPGETVWHPAPMPEGALPMYGTADILVTGKGILAVGNGGAILFSEDDGATWKSHGRQSIIGSRPGIAVEFRDTILLLASPSVTILFSVDNGRTWKPYDVLSFPATALAADNGTLYATASDGLYRREENGEWKMTGAAADDVRAVGLSGDTLVCLNASSVLTRSTDAGKSWDTIRSGPELTTVVLHGGVIRGAGESGIYSVPIEGNEWKKEGERNPHQVALLEMLEADGRLFIADRAGVFVFDPATGEFDGLDAGMNEQSVYKFIRRGDSLIVVTAFGMSITGDGGKTWLRRNGPDTPGLRGVESGSRGLYAHTVAFDTLFFSDDNAQSWRPMPVGEQRAGYISALRVSGDSIVVGRQRTLSRSTDGGESWQNFGMPDTIVRFAGAGDTLFGAGSEDDPDAGTPLYRSSDFGETWRAVPFEDTTMRFIYCDYEQGTLYVGGSDLRLLRSFDQGDTWRNVGERLREVGTNDNPHKGVTYIEAFGDILFAQIREDLPGTGIGYWMVVSSDRGESWQTLPPFPGIAYAIFPDGDRILAGSFPGGFATDNTLSNGRESRAAAEDPVRVVFHTAGNAIRLHAQKPTVVQIGLYSLNGELLEMLLEGAVPSGMREIPLSTAGMPVGPYLLVVETPAMRQAWPIVPTM